MPEGTEQQPTSRGVKGWRAWYRGGWFRNRRGRVFSSRDTEWADLPESGMLFLVVYLDKLTPSGVPYRETYSGADWYWRKGCCTFGTVPSSAKRGEWAKPPQLPNILLKRGEYVSNREMERIRLEALAVREF